MNILDDMGVSKLSGYFYSESEVIILKNVAVMYSSMKNVFSCLCCVRSAQLVGIRLTG